MVSVGRRCRRDDQSGCQGEPGKYSREYAHAVIPFRLAEWMHTPEPNAQLLHNHYLMKVSSRR